MDSKGKWIRRKGSKETGTFWQAGRGAAKGWGGRAMKKRGWRVERGREWKWLKNSSGNGVW